MTSQLAEEEEKAKNLSKLKNKQELMIVDLEGEERAPDRPPGGGSRQRSSVMETRTVWLFPRESEERTSAIFISVFC